MYDTALQVPDMHTPDPEGAPRRRRKVVLTIAALGVVSVVGGMATWSAFVGTTQNPGNTFSAVSVQLTDNDTVDAPIFTVSNMSPGESVEKCIEVSYASTTAATSEVRLYASAKGAGSLNDDLDVVVKRGTSAGSSAGDCDTFVEDSPVVLSHGALTIDSFPGAYGAGLDGSTWADQDSHVYQFTVTLDAAVDAAESGASGGPVTFTWEARPTP